MGTYPGVNFGHRDTILIVDTSVTMWTEDTAFMKHILIWA